MMYDYCMTFTEMTQPDKDSEFWVVFFIVFALKASHKIKIIKIILLNS
jgi:hypothetical protein